jgi:hypothetical protein
MTISSLKTLLEDAKFDVHLGSAPDGTACPYIVMRDIEQPNFAADNITYTETTSLRLDLVESEVHNWSLHSTLKGVLDNNSLPYSVTFVDDTSEHVCETYYDIRFQGGILNG